MSTSIVVLYSIVSLTVLSLYFLEKYFSYWHDRNVPCVGPLQYLQSLVRTAQPKHITEVIKLVYHQFRGQTPFVGFYYSLRRAALILDLDLAKNILIRDFNIFADRGLYSNEKDDPLTGHLIVLDGKRWKELRSLLSPTFTSGKMKFMHPTILEVGHRFADVLRDRIRTNPDVVEVKDLLARFTTDVIGTCAFGIECNSLRDPYAQFRVMGEKVFSQPRHGKLGEAFYRTCPRLAKWFRVKLIDDEVSRFFMNAVRETVDYRETNNIKRNDFMDILIELKNAELQPGAGARPTMEQLAAQAFVFFLAGFETSATTMSFCLYELALNSDIQEKLRHEINKVFQAHNHKFTYESLKEIKYLHQVISETLRRYPVAPILYRKSLNDYKVPNSNLTLEKNTLIMLPTEAYHMDPDLYPEPYKFDPNRFAPEEVQNRHPCAWLPFGVGPRSCIGMRFGKMQTSIGLALLVRNFRFSISPLTTVPIVINPDSRLLSSKGGILLKVETVI